MPEMSVPFGDDVAAIPLNSELLAVLKTDVLVGRTDIPPHMTLKQAARKAVVMNISDFAAKGVKPLALLTALTIPRTFLKKDIEEIGGGLNSGAREYNTYIIGGDTGEGIDLTIGCMVFGVAKRNRLILRSGAKAGDILAVTGLFGKTSAGLKILTEELYVSKKIREKLIKSVLLPKARLREGVALAKINAATSSIDSSDGLAVSLHELKEKSNIGFVITKLPIAPQVNEFAKIHGFNPKDLACYGGEEYELILTITPDKWQKAKRVVAQVGGKLIPIGKAVKEKKIILKKGSTIEKIQFYGWEHFKKQR